MLTQSANENLPLVSVIIPTYNSSSLIADAVESVLEQTYQRYEIIVVDDGSTDETKEVLKQFDGQINYIYRQNRGPSAARNAGLAVAGGQYICFLDADDIWLPIKLEVQLAFISQHSDIGLVFSDEEECDAEKTLYTSLLARTYFEVDIRSQIPIRDAFRKLLIENFVPTSTVMTRRECFLKAGSFDEDLKVCEDRDMWLRIAAYFKIACLPLVLGKKRVHQSNISSDGELTLRSRVKVWKDKRRLFPSLTPDEILSSLFADTYLQLAYLLLAKNQGKEARQMGFQSMAYALKALGVRRTSQKYVAPYRWSLGIGLIPLTLIRPFFAIERMLAKRA